MTDENNDAKQPGHEERAWRHEEFKARDQDPSQYQPWGADPDTRNPFPRGQIPAGPFPTGTPTPGYAGNPLPGGMSPHGHIGGVYPGNPFPQATPAIFEQYRPPEPIGPLSDKARAHMSGLVDEVSEKTFKLLSTYEETDQNVIIKELVKLQADLWVVDVMCDSGVIARRYLDNWSWTDPRVYHHLDVLLGMMARGRNEDRPDRWATSIVDMLMMRLTMPTGKYNNWEHIREFYKITPADIYRYV